MGVTILQPFPILENRTGPGTIDFLTKRLLALGAVQTGGFLVDCETFQSVPQLGSSKVVHVLHNSEQPVSVFSIMDTGTKQIPLVADSLFDLLIENGTGIYIKETNKGPRLEVGDFVIKLGSVIMVQTFKGILIEVEYRPCVIPANCWELMREFMQGFMGNHMPSQIPSYFTAQSQLPNANHQKQNDIYQPMDTIQQYLEHFSNYRKQTKTPAGAIRS